MARGNPKKLADITNTPRGKKAVAEEPEHGAVVPDEDIVDLHLDVSDDSCQEETMMRYLAHLEGMM